MCDLCEACLRGRNSWRLERYKFPREHRLRFLTKQPHCACQAKSTTVKTRADHRAEGMPPKAGKLKISAHDAPPAQTMDALGPAIRTKTVYLAQQ